MNELWYLGAMNDGLAIIDVPPSPAPVDHVNPNKQAPSLIIPLRNNDRITQEVAEQIVREHNASIKRICELLDCPICGAHKSFMINPLNSAVGYCMEEHQAWRITSKTCETPGCLNQRAAFGDYCMKCLEVKVNSASTV